VKKKVGVKQPRPRGQVKGKKDGEKKKAKKNPFAALQGIRRRKKERAPVGNLKIRQQKALVLKGKVLGGEINKRDWGAAKQNRKNRPAKTLQKKTGWYKVAAPARNVWPPTAKWNENQKKKKPKTREPANERPVASVISFPKHDMVKKSQRKITRGDKGYEKR